MWLKNHLQRAFANWDGQPLYRATLTSYEEWNNTRRGRKLRDDYAGRYLRLTIGYAGEQWIFFPGEAGERDLVFDPAQEVLDALLLVPAYANGKRRTQLPKKVAGMRRTADEAPEQLPDELRTVQMQLPHYVSADVAERVCPDHGLHVNGLYQVSGCALANRICQADVSSEADFRTGGFTSLQGSFRATADTGRPPRLSTANP
jgi:hypothetical protein